jgi:hypothetical protein
MAASSGTIVPFTAAGSILCQQAGDLDGTDRSIVLNTWKTLTPHEKGITQCLATVSAALDFADRPDEGVDIVFKHARVYLSQFFNSPHFWDLKAAFKSSLMQKHVSGVKDANRKKANRKRIDRFLGLVQKDKDREFMNTAIPLSVWVRPQHAIV